MNTETKTQHTPGPWQLLKVGSDYLAVSLDRKTNLAEWPTNYDQRDLADARLIAAAPDLLFALQECVNFLDTLPNRDEITWQIAMAVIAKAKGEAN